MQSRQAIRFKDPRSRRSRKIADRAEFKQREQILLYHVSGRGIEVCMRGGRFVAQRKI